MGAAQKLYEAGYITYMRTDLATLSEEAQKDAQDFVLKTYGQEFVGLAQPKKKKVASPKEEVKAQEAHEAIRPTKMDILTLPTSEDWSLSERKIYSLIWMRTIQSVMAPVKGEQRTVIIVADGDDAEDFTWRASWRRTLFEGWRKISLKEKSEEETQEKDSEYTQWQVAEAMKAGQKVKWVQMGADPHTTKAKQHYNEANLIHELEINGIGRPSTFANLISTILDREYVETKNFPSHEIQVKKLSMEPGEPIEEEIVSRAVGGEKSRLAPTALGKSVLQFLLQNFDDLFQYTFTAQMEKQLDKIAEGQEAWKKVLKDTWNAYKERYSVLKGQPSTVSGDRRRVLGDLVAVIGKKGPLLLKENEDKDKTIFYGWPDGVTFQDLTLEQAVAFSQQLKPQGESLGIHEGHEVVRKDGKFGSYAAWNGKTVSCTLEDTLETIVEKFGKQASLKTIGAFEIRSGPYGLYMFKKDATKRTFVSVPAIDLETVTEEELIVIFQNGLKAKAKGAAYSSRGTSGARGARGRGGFRGSRGRGT
jgi:DNA topoisomerase-1